MNVVHGQFLTRTIVGIGIAIIAICTAQPIQVLLELVYVNYRTVINRARAV